jgi:putative transcriptional regulator
MTMDSAPINLTHHFLIAMPGLMDESFFPQCGLYVRTQRARRLGLIINKPSPMSMQSCLKKSNCNSAAPI